MGHQYQDYVDAHMALCYCRFNSLSAYLFVLKSRRTIVREAGWKSFVQATRDTPAVCPPPESPVVTGDSWNLRD